MKNKSFVLLFIFFFFSSSSIYAQWIPTGGPLGCSANQFAKSNGGKLWVCADNGLYYSTNDGNNWNPINKKLDYCTQVIAFGDTIMAVYNPFIRSTVLWNSDYYQSMSITSIDNGITWGTAHVIDTLSQNNTIDLQFELKKIGNAYIYSHQSGGYVFESNDFGVNWTDSITTAIPYTTVLNSLYINQTAFHLEEGFNIASQPMLYNCVSFDGRNTWAYIDSSGNNNLKAIGAIDNAILFLADTLVPKIFRSNNLGMTFDTVLVSDPQFPFYSSIYNDKDTLYIKFVNNSYIVRTYKSIDKGITWNAMPAHFPDLSNSLFCKTSTGDYLYGIPWGFYLWKYDPINDTSINFNTNIRSRWTKDLISSGEDLYCLDMNNIFRSSDDGLTWSQLTNYPQTQTNIDYIKAKGDTVIYITTNDIYVSFNKGNFWSIYPNSNQFLWPSVYITSTGLLYQNNQNSLQISTNWGQSWTSLPLPSISASSSNIIIQDDSYNIYDYIVDTNSNAQLYNYNPTLQQFMLVGNSNVTSVTDPQFAVAKVGSRWFTYGYNNLAPLATSIDGLNWTQSNLLNIPSSALPHPYFGKPAFANGLYFSFFNDSSMISSFDGVNWNLMPNSNNLKFQTNWMNNIPQEMVSHKGILYMPSFSSSVWRRNDTIRNFTGNVYFDINNNGIKDAGETNLQNMVVATSNSFGNTNSLGEFSLLTDQIGDSLKVTLPSNAFTSNPSFRITNNSQLSNNNFGLNAPANVSDFKTDITNASVFRPGFNTNVFVNVFNNATLNQTSTLNVTIDTNVIVIAANPTPTSISGNVYSWNLPTLPFTQQQTIQLNVQTKVTATLGNVVHFISSITPATTDINMSNNIDSLNEIIVGSYDPNDKTCKQGSSYNVKQLNDGEELEYVIRFQNTGTFPASYVRIEDTLSTMLDWSSIKIVNASHQMNYTLKGNGAVHFIFDPISLPGMVQNELESHGFVKYTILPKKSISVGNVINNTAFIYFDFNSPIVTNTTLTEITYKSIVLTTEEIPAIDKYKNSILIYPNPAFSSFYINYNDVLINYTSTLLLYDVNGRKVLQKI